MRGHLARIADSLAEGVEEWAQRQRRQNRLRAVAMTEEDADLLITSIAALGFTPEEAIEVLSAHVRRPERAR